MSQPTDQWGPKLAVHRMETHSPKHTDSQVPLALPNYDPDGDIEYPDDFNRNKYGNGYAGDDISENEGLHLTIPRSLHETGL